MIAPRVRELGSGVVRLRGLARTRGSCTVTLPACRSFPCVCFPAHHLLWRPGVWGLHSLVDASVVVLSPSSSASMRPAPTRASERPNAGQAPVDRAFSGLLLGKSWEVY